MSNRDSQTKTAWWWWNSSIPKPSAALALYRESSRVPKQSDKTLHQYAFHWEYWQGATMFTRGLSRVLEIIASKRTLENLNAADSGNGGFRTSKAIARC